MFPDVTFLLEMQCIALSIWKHFLVLMWISKFDKYLTKSKKKIMYALELSLCL